MPSADSPWWSGLSLAEREEAFEDALVSWHECYAEAGSSWVCGGGNPHDAYLAASRGAGSKPKRADYGLPPVEYAAPPTPPSPVSTDDEIPF